MSEGCYNHPHKEGLGVQSLQKVERHTENNLGGDTWSLTK